MEFWDQHCYQFLMQLDTSESAKIAYAEIHGLVYKEFTKNIAKFIVSNGLPEKNKLFEALDEPLSQSEVSVSDQNISAVLSDFRQIQEKMTVTPKRAPRLIVDREPLRKEKSERSRVKKTRKQQSDIHESVLSTEVAKPVKVKKKVDYLKHCKKFLKGLDNSAAARKSYAELRGINDNTFRVHLSKYIKSKTFVRSISQQSVMRELKKRKSKVDVVKQGGVNLNLYNLDDGCRTFVKGNNAGETHGLRSKTSSEIKSLTDNIYSLSKESLFDFRLKLCQRVAYLDTLYADYKHIIESDYANDNPIVLKKLMASKVVNCSISKVDAITEVKNKLTPEIFQLKALIQLLNDQIAEVGIENNHDF